MDEIKSFLAGKVQIVKWFGQNTYEIKNGKTGDLLTDEKMELTESVEGQDLIFVCKK